MKKTLFVIVLAMFSSYLLASPIGKWKTVDDETGKTKSVVEIWESSGKYYGKIIKLFRKPNETPDPICDKCEGVNKNKKIIGMTILWDLKKDDDEYAGGRIMDPKNGKVYKAKIQVLNNGKKLKVRGYIGFSLFGRTQYWYQVDKD